MRIEQVVLFLGYYSCIGRHCYIGGHFCIGRLRDTLPCEQEREK